MLSFFNFESIQIVRKSYLGTENEYGIENFQEELIEAKAAVGQVSTRTDSEIQQVEIETKFKLVFEEGFEILDDDVFLIRGTEWVKDGNSFHHDFGLIPGDFLPKFTAVFVKQNKGNVGQ